ncbi:protein tamozhennic-like [Haematobia irritans]|uniref:protein tamozhennic-like n=1 Tax=Haematobia irritans TaxID=7368 RepID=UPI003F5002EB
MSYNRQDIFEKIVKQHWVYLRTEDAVHKLEVRKQLDVSLKEFLGTVYHGEKFSLPETSLVLSTSIRELTHFDIKKAMSAFVVIGQYANNLLKQPWRKEFRFLKMHSGFFQHELRSNLSNVEKLFEVMGYRRLCDDILIFNGPICVENLVNVSRDAIIAFAELEIMKNISMVLEGCGFKIPWLEILIYRESNKGPVSKAITGLLLANEEICRRIREITTTENNYQFKNVHHHPMTLHHNRLYKFPEP